MADVVEDEVWDPGVFSDLVARVFGPDRFSVSPLHGKNIAVLSPAVPQRLEDRTDGIREGDYFSLFSALSLYASGLSYRP